MGFVTKAIAARSKGGKTTALRRELEVCPILGLDADLLDDVLMHCWRAREQATPWPALEVSKAVSAAAKRVLQCCARTPEWHIALPVLQELPT